MEPDDKRMEIPACTNSHEPRFGWELRFRPSPQHPIRETRDVDYEAYGFRTKSGATLESWFGPTAAEVDASEERFVKSTTFFERFVTDPNGHVIGIDARGIYRNGKRWRWFGVLPGSVDLAVSALDNHPTWPRLIATNAIGYDEATDREIREFESILDSVCYAVK